MGNNIVKYHNHLNEVSLRKFTSLEMDLFFAICSKMRNQQTNEVTFSFEQLRSLSEYSMTANKPFINDLKSLYEKMLQLIFRFDSDEDQQTYFVLFTQFTIDQKNQCVSIVLNKDFSFMLNELTQNFTIFELKEFTNLSSSYSKTSYRLLKQWKTVGRKQWDIDEFRKLLSVPKNYRMSEIDKYVLAPMYKELTPIFKDLKIEKIKKGRGGKVVALEFVFKKEVIPRKKDKKFYKKESLPEWAKEDYVTSRDDYVDEDSKKLLEQKLDKIRNKKYTDNI